VIAKIVYDRKGGAAELARAVDETRAAMRRRVDVIYQPAFLGGGFRGHADFVVRVDEASALGGWSYEPYDAKLARTAVARALMQLCVYAEQIAAIQGRTPTQVHLVLGGPVSRTESFRLATLAAYYRRVRASLVAAVSGPDATFPPATGYPEPVEHCEICNWSKDCEARLRDDDHLSLVAGISRTQRRGLRERGIETVAGLASLPLPLTPPLERSSAVAVERIREQARLQVEGRVVGETIAEVIARLEIGRGLAALPEPSTGDLFFDIEGDPFARAADGDRLVGEDGLEYLFGLIEPDPPADDGTPRFHSFSAFDRAAERRAFEQVIDLIVETRARHPRMHVFHYAAYEQTALKRLANRYGTRVDELDDLLRAGVFVDLYRVVRQGIRASVESYSIKKLEPLYKFERSVELRDANTCLREFESWLELSETLRTSDEAKQILSTIAGYNRDDCLSTWRLRDWLEEKRDALAAIVRVGIPRPAPREDKQSQKANERDARVDAVEQALLAGMPEDPTERTTEQQGRWLLAQLLEWHRREDKSAWWEYFKRLELTNEELVEDAATLGGLEYEGPIAREKRSTIYRFRFPPQEHAFDTGTDARDVATGESIGKPHAIDSIAGTIDFKRESKRPAPAAAGLVPLKIFGNAAQREAILRLGERVAQAAAPASPAALDLLLRARPRCADAPGAALVRPGEDLLAACVRLALAQTEGVLPIQGPPGTGKTHAGAHMIVALLKAGRRVGITANSHRVITNLLDKVLEVAQQEGVAVSAVQKPDADGADCTDNPLVRLAEENADVEAAVHGGANLIAGTSWLWARPEMANTVHTLFIDEAGQMSLANAVAVSAAAPAMVLLGDPQQLDQPRKGVHPPGADASALGHVLGGDKTIDDKRGVFLAQTWRLHPDLCKVTSELFYEDRLEPVAELERQRIEVAGPLGGTGFRMVYVRHQGNQNTSLEEVEKVREIYAQLTAERAAWIDRNGDPHEMTGEGVLVVAPYNAHVAALKAALPAGAKVGTVDKFQGQEAPVVIYSLASSTADDAPRGMEFLYNLNRLNVATSRARCLAVVVCSPCLLEVGCRTARQAVMANGLCGVAESCLR
jgi:uncharacterized protein